MIQDLYRTNPFLMAQDQMVGWWFDQWMGFMLTLHYWPNFVVGSADSFADLFKPQTYSICRI